jgi:hypothetical protein
MSLRASKDDMEVWAFMTPAGLELRILGSPSQSLYRLIWRLKREMGSTFNINITRGEIYV